MNRRPKKARNSVSIPASASSRALDSILAEERTWPSSECPGAIVVAGGSRGGVAALQQLLSSLPPDFPAPFAVVLHRDRTSDHVLLRVIGRQSSLPVEEVTDKLPLQSGRVFVAPADYHLLIEEGHFALSVDPPVRWSRPSIDLLFESAADAYGPNVIGIVLSGANDDGARGAARISQCGGRIAIQDPSTAECPIMPRAALAATQSSHVHPLDQLGVWLAQELIRVNPTPQP